MQQTRRFFSYALALALLTGLLAAGSAQAQTIAYQGYLTNDEGTPANGNGTIVFRLYDAAAGGTLVWQEQQTGVAVADGLFSVQLGSVEPFGDVPFGRPLWLGVSIGGQDLNPRVPLTAVPYAMNVRGLRVLPGGGANQSPSLIGGHAANRVDAIEGAVIGGGGGSESALQNRVTEEGSYATIGGGIGNVASDFGATIGGGDSNEAPGEHSTIGGGFTNTASEAATVGGGQGNTADGFSATIGGGTSNVASGEYATVAGGEFNEATGDHSYVGGGRDNRATGMLATVPGGFQSWATGFVSFAAGYNARAAHDGAFVWTDTEGIPTPFSSTGPDQFLIRAAGGVGIGTNAPRGALHLTETSLGISEAAFSDDALIVEGDRPVIGVYATFQSNTRPGLVLAGVEDNGDVIDKWSIVREFFGLNGLHFTYGTNEDHTQNPPVLSLSADQGAAAERFVATDDLGANGTPLLGGHYRDNVVYAWAHVLPDGTVTASYGCTVTKITGTGRYRVTFKRQLPNGASAVVTVQTLNDPVIATAVTNALQADVATKVFNGAAFVGADYGFYIQVVGRP